MTKQNKSYLLILGMSIDCQIHNRLLCVIQIIILKLSHDNYLKRNFKQHVKSREIL